MTPERWQQVDKVFQAALARPSNQRADFLDEACAGDERLRKEVESLIGFHERARSFMEAPALEGAPDWLSGEKTESMIGRKIGPYNVLGLIAHGGMGDVYLAQDTGPLRRKIALKLLPAYCTREEERVRRFQREARAASALNHPNILTVYEIGQAEGTHFIAMEFIEGQTLRQHIARGRMKLCEMLDGGIQVAGALAAAHAAGIVHRDIKPENVMVRPDGYVKVLDFGIAKLSGRQAGTNDATASPGSGDTELGKVMGTAAYMSPEQARGEELDARTDLFSLGAVLYEIATGRQAFSGATFAVMHDAILNRAPTSPLRLNPELPAQFERIISKALEKDRKLRYQTASDLGTDLQRLKRDLDSGRGAAPSDVDTSRGSRKAIDSLAVLPLVNASGDPETEYLSEGITESIINSLSQLPELRVLPRSVVFRYRGKDADPQTVGRDLSVGAVLTGRVLQQDDTLIIGTELVDVENGWQLWGERYNRNLSDIFAVQEEIAKEISEKLRLRLTGEEKERLSKRYTQDIEAYQDYLKGRYYWEKWTQDGWKRAIEYFQQAIEKDPAYARAYSGLADSYLYLGWFSVLPPNVAYPRAKAAATKALEIDDCLAEAHNSLASVRAAYDWNWSDAEREFKRAIELNPNYATAHHWYAEYLKQMGRNDEALAEIKRAQELDPLSLIVTTSVGWQYYFARLYDRAIEQYQLALEMDPNFGPAHWGLGWAYEQKALFEEAIAEFQKGVSLSGGNPVYVAALGHAFAVARKGEEAQRVLDELKELSKRLYVPPYFVAAIYTGLGDSNQAFEWLEKAYEEHSSWLLYLRGEPRLDSLRSDPRFYDLLRRVGLPPQGLAWRAWSLRVRIAALAVVLVLAAYLVRFRPPRAPPAGKIMLAVLPFDNLSADPGQEYFSDGLTEETIAQLGGLEPERLGVIARTSAMKYKHTNKDVQQIGRELGVQYLLEGTVRRASDRVRITAQLIQVSDQTHLLAETYERDLGDIFTLQSDVAKAVADKIQIQLTAPQRARLATPKPVKREAHEAYLRGRFFWNKRYEAEDWVKKSAEYFQEAIQEDPKFALAYAGLADYYNLLGSNGVDAMPPREARPKARAAAEQALELDDSLAEAHTSLASILSAYDWNFQKAEEEFKRAMKLNANYATAHYWYSANLIAMGRLDEAIAESKRAQELDPLSLIVNVDLAWKYYLVRQYDQAIEQCRKTMELDPNLYLTDYILGIALEQKKDYPKAIFELQRGVSLSKTSPIMLMAVGHAEAVSGNAAEVRKSLEELKKLSKQRYVPAVYFAAVYTGLGDKDRAFEWLTKAVDERSDQLINLNVEPMADSLRSDPRYKEIIHRIGLPP